MTTDTDTAGAPETPTDPPFGHAAAPAAVDDWTAKIERLRQRKPAETFRTIPDTDALQVVAEKRQVWLDARSAAIRELPQAGSLTPAEIDAFLDDRADVTDALADLNAAVTAAEDAEIVFHFRALPPDVYAGLSAQHPPTSEQEDRDMVHNPETYVPALISACSVKPITPEQVAALIHPDGDRPAPLNHGDVAALVDACVEVNERPRMMLGKGSRPTAD